MVKGENVCLLEGMECGVHRTPCVFDYRKYQENSYQDMTAVCKPT